MLDGANRRLLELVAVLTVAFLWVLWALHRPPGPTEALTLRAGGATSIYPMMAKWTAEYRKVNGIQVSYAATGSGAGKALWHAATIDCCCVDVPLTREEIGKATIAHSDVVHIPLAMGAVVPIYNLDEIRHKVVRFTGEVLAEIYLGKIKNWNDSKLQALQEPGLTLPDKDIVVVHRSDASGKTRMWTEYLDKSSAEWKEKVGTGLEIHWPVGIGTRGGGEGPTAHVKQTPGAIAYIELIYALGHNVQIGMVKNQAGSFIVANLSIMTAAAANSLAQIPNDLRYSLIDASGSDSYPICGTNWAVVYVDPPSGKGRAIYDFLWWVTHDGQSLCESLYYGRLPMDLIPRIEQQLEKIKK